MSLRNRRGRTNYRNIDSFPGNRTKRNWWRRIIVSMLLIFGAVIALLLVTDYSMNNGKIYQGVSAGGVDLGGKTREEAQNLLEERTNDLKQIALTGPQDLTVSSKDLGVSFDVRGTVDRAYAVGRQGNLLKRIYDRVEAMRDTVSIPLTVNYKREQLRNGLSGIFSALAVEPVEAGFKFDGNGVSVTPSQTGQKVDEDKLLDDIEAGLPQGKREYEVQIATQEPKLTTEEANRLKPTTVIGRYRTDYRLTSDKSKERVDNLRIASNAITGTALAPGEVFSLSDIAEPLDYNKTSVIIEGKEDKADGGGLCQVTSTLYMAANYADLNIVERHPHYAQLPYIRPGLDATVWFGSLDMKFENTTDAYLLLREYVADDGYIYAEIWGQPTGNTVEMDSESEYVGPDYSKWVTYKKVTDPNGKVLFDDVFHKDTYQPLVDEHGKVIRPDSKEVTVAPINP